MTDNLNLLIGSALLKHMIDIPNRFDNIPINLLDQFPFPGTNSSQFSFQPCRDMLTKLLNPSSINDLQGQTQLAVNCIQIADNLAAGFRMSETNNKQAPSYLESIFGKIELTHPLTRKGFHSLLPLFPDEKTLFPKQTKQDASHDEYLSLLNQFIKDANQLKKHYETSHVPPHFYIHGLVSMLEKYAWCLPMADNNLSGISVFDHSYMLASIAQCLFLYHSYFKTSPTWEDQDHKFVFVAGDLSGIQSYIFGINRSGARGISKMFRARSFYLQALMTSILLWIEQQCQVDSVCRIVKAGGKCVMLLPNIPQVTDAFQRIETNSQTWFKNKYKGRLTLNLSLTITAQQNDFLGPKFRKKMDEVNDSLEQAKYVKLKHTLTQSPIIHQNYNEYHNGNCSLCTHNAATDYLTLNKETGEQITVCKDCLEQIENIGTPLPKEKYNYLVYYDQAQSQSIKNASQLFNNISLHITEAHPKSFHKIMQVESFSNQIECFDTARLARFLPEITQEELNDEALKQLLSEDINGKNLNVGDPKTFGMIAIKSKKKSNNSYIGRSLLGFVKADVDNLGLIFSTGLKNHSASGFLALSRMINYFFSDYLLHLVKETYHDIYVVFSGGDDLFLVGPWNQVIDCMITLQEKFTQFCANHKDMHFSCGILPAKPRLPMSQAAELVEKQLEKAKHMMHKNAVCLLQTPVQWSFFKTLIQDVGKIMDQAVDNESKTGFSTSFLFRLLSYHRMYKKFMHYKHGGTPKNITCGNYAALAYYDIGRNLDKKDLDNETEKDMLYRIMSVGKDPHEKNELNHLDIPLFYAINLNRS